MAVSPAFAAATIVLLRNAASGGPGIDIFLLRRAARGAFAGAHVFPGGRLDADDALPSWRGRCDGVDEFLIRCAGHLEPADALAHAVAGIREAFEECGILLGGAPDLVDEARRRARADLLAGGVSFSGWCAAQDIRLRVDLLFPWAHWITPEAEPRRFDTWFFLAHAPADQAAHVVTGEAVDGTWSSPGDALDALAAGRIQLAPPTLRTMEELASCESVPQALARTDARRLTAVMPVKLTETEVLTLVLPGDPEHGPGAPCGVDGPPRFEFRDGHWRSAVV